MLKHARAGVPLEVMGLMLGTFVDEYTIKVVDVFAMPQSGTGVNYLYFHMILGISRSSRSCLLIKHA